MIELKVLPKAHFVQPFVISCLHKTSQQKNAVEQSGDSSFNRAQPRYRRRANLNQIDSRS